MFETSTSTPTGFHAGHHAATPSIDRAPRARVDAPKRITSGLLLSGGNEVVIEHAGQEYRLRLTRNDKLILTK